MEQGVKKMVANQHNSKIILFDGVCKICDRSMLFIIKRDPNKKFVFASLQSDIGQDLVDKYSLPDDMETMILIEGDVFYIQSDAVLRIVKELNGLWPILGVFDKLPRAIRDYAYKKFSMNRYRLFGKKEQCELPSAEVRSRFL